LLLIVVLSEDVFSKAVNDSDKETSGD